MSLYGIHKLTVKMSVPNAALVSGGTVGIVVHQLTRIFLESNFKATLQEFKKSLTREIWYKKGANWIRDKDNYSTTAEPPAGASRVIGDPIPFRERMLGDFQRNLPGYDLEIFNLLYEIFEAANPSTVKLELSGAAASAANFLLGVSTTSPGDLIVATAELQRAIKAELKSHVKVSDTWSNFLGYINLIKNNCVSTILSDLTIANPTLLKVTDRKTFLDKAFNTKKTELKTLDDFIKNLKSELNTESQTKIDQLTADSQTTITQLKNESKARTDQLNATLVEKNNKIAELERERDQARNSLSIILKGDVLAQVQLIKTFADANSLGVCSQIPLSETTLDAFLRANFQKMIGEIFGLVLQVKPTKIDISQNTVVFNRAHYLNRLISLINFVKLHKFV